MARLQLTLACGDYDLTQPLTDGTVRPRGIDLVVVTLPSPERHWRMLRHEEFDVCELSMASYLVERSRGERFVAIPVFPHRRFRHSYVFVNAGKGIEGPQDLAGRRVGLRTFQNTAGVWVRGMLQHEYGVDLGSIQWVTQDEEDVPIDAVRRFRVERVPQGTTIDEMLVRGELDAVIYPDTLPSFERQVPSVRRLFRDARAEEEAYYRRTGIFPIMHTVVVKGSVIERWPWVAVNLLEAFELAKQECYRRLRDPRRVSLAWALHLLEEQRRILGPDPWAYGLEPNRRAIETIALYAYEQGLTERLVTPEELFFPSTLERIPRFLP